MDSPSIVLRIPVPRVVQALPDTPPIPWATDGDRIAVELLRGWGIGRGINKKEIAQACCLAHGLSDMIILLERPYAKTYDTTFQQFIQGSDTLRAVDDLIRFATKGARSIHTVTVLDAFSFQKNRNHTDCDLECHRLLAQIIQVKKPKVIIRCHRDAYKDEWMKRFEMPQEWYSLERKEVEVDSSHTTVVFQSFHPSCAVHNADYRPEYRALLIHHFIAAFGDMHGQGQLPEYAEDLRQLCLRKGDRKTDPFCTSYMAARYTTNALFGDYDYRDKSFPVEIGGLERLERIKDHARAFSNMYQVLRHLAQGNCSPGALAIGRTLLFNWNQFFSEEPLFKQVYWLLRVRGMEQLDWITSKSTSKDDTVPWTLTEIPGESTVHEPDLPQGDLVERRLVMIGRIKERTRATQECLRRSSVTELTESLRIAGIIAYHDEFVKAFEQDGYVMTKGDKGLAMDLLFFQKYLGELDGFLEGRVVVNSEREKGPESLVIRKRRRVRP